MELTIFFVNLSFLLGFAFVPLGPFFWGNDMTTWGDSGNKVLGGLMLVASIAAVLSFIFLLKANRKLPINILLIVCFFLIVDRIMSVIMSWIPSVA